MDQLAKQVAELALRLTTLPAGGLRTDTQTLDAVERLANQILSEVSAARLSAARAPGESRGMWRVMQPLVRQ